MDIKVFASQIIVISSLLCSTFSNIDMISYNNHTYINDIDWNNIYDVTESQLVAEIPNSNIKLYYVKEDKDYEEYVGFILQINEAKKFYKWVNVANPPYAPKLELSNLNNDGIEEIVVHLIKGYGTGIYDEEVHVIKQPSSINDAFNEILIENPLIILNKNAKAKEFPDYFEVSIKNKKFKVNKKGILIPPYEKVGVGFGEGNTQYEVKNNTLYAKVRVGADMINIGELIIKYKYQDKILQMDSIDFFRYR